MVRIYELFNFKYFTVLSCLILSACKPNGSVDNLFGAPANEVIVEVPQDLQITVTTPDVDGKNVGYQIYMEGGCTLPGGIVEFRGDATGFSVCQANNTWSAEVDVSGVTALGNISVEAYLVDGNDESAPAIRILNKENLDCNSSSARTAFNAGGTGTLGDPYRICTATQFNNIRSAVTSHYILKNELDLQNVPFAPISANFSGSLEGNDYTIRNLYVYDLSGNDVGLFKSLHNGAIIRNLTIENANVNGPSIVGIVAGRVFGTDATFQSVDLTGRVSGTGNWIGGMIGRVDANTNLTVSDSTISLTSLTGSGYGGGLLGGTQDGTGIVTLTNINVSGSVTLSTTYGGGVVGIIDSNNALSALTQITSSVDVSINGGSSDNYVGGIVGRMDNGDIDTCTTSGLVSATGSYVGGVVGQFSGTKVWNCSSTGAIQVDTSSRASGYVGGMIGYATTASTDLYNLDVQADISVFGTNVSSYFGGIGGRVFATTIDTCSAHGDPSTSNSGTLTVNTGDGATTGSNQVGGAFGRFDILDGGTLTITDCSADVDVTNVGANNSAFTGGFLGYSSPTDTNSNGSDLVITNSTASGDVVSSNDYIGGYAGYIYLPRSGSYGHFTNVHASGDVTVTSMNSQAIDYVGGLVGALPSRDAADAGFSPPAGFQLTNVSATGNVSVDTGAAGGSYIGGLLGYIRSGRSNSGGAVSSITNAFATGDVEVLSTGSVVSYVGGLIGDAYSAQGATMTIGSFGNTVYATGDVSGQANRIGGLIGQFDSTTDGISTLQYAYSNGNVSGNRYVGGLIGLVSNGGGSANMLINQVQNHDSNVITPYPTVTATVQEVGGLIGYATSTSTSLLISNCESRSDVTSSGTYAGGLIGQDRSNVDITSCSAYGDVSSVGGYAGGLTAGSDQTGRDFTDVHAEGDVTTTITGVNFNNVMTGGLVGYHRGSLTNATASGDVNIIITPGSSISNAYVGGLVGYAQTSTISEAWAIGNVSYDTLGVGTMNFTGGLIGYQNSGSPITNSFALGDVIGGDQTGGLIGRADGTVTHAMAGGNVSGTRYVGGLIGYYNYAAADGATVVYALGSVSRNAGANLVNFGQLAGICNGNNNNRISTVSAHYNQSLSTIEAGLTAYAPCNSTTARNVLDTNMLAPGSGFNAAFVFDCSATANAGDWCYPTAFEKKGSGSTFLYPLPYWATP